MRLPKILVVPVLLLLTGLSLSAQNRTVQGTVVDSSQLPLPGVGVVLDGTTNGTITGADGKFSVRIPAGDAVLVFSSLGYQTKSVPVPAGSNATKV